ncbi:MAG: type II secretion system F family protein [Eubacteriales bacterium]|nr:type II secretion system F family protein [Eubacteriales bacterium]
MVEAYDEFDAVARIKENYPIVLSVAEVQEHKESFLTRDIGGPRKVKLKHLALVCSQFSIILGAGLPMVRSVELVAEQTADKTLRKILDQVAGDVAAGNSLAESFASKGKQLPTTFIETIRAGEEAGTLDTAFQNLFTYFDKSAKTHDKIVSALIYPVFLIVLAIVVVIVLMVTAIPMFTQQFADLGGQLPLVTRMLIGMSNFMTAYWMFLVGGVLLAVFLLKIWSKTEKGKTFFATLRLRFPVLRNVERMNAASQFANTMSTILSVGMPMTRTIVITSRVITNYVVGLSVRDMVAGVEEGRHLGDCMRSCKWLPDLLTEMTAVGEDSGSLENTLGVIGSYYDNEVNIAVSRMLSILEPAIIVVMAIFVVFILLGFYMPMIGMYGLM